MAAVIERERQVVYHPSHVARRLHACGWSRRKLTRCARQRSEEAVQEWTGRAPARPEKKAIGEGRTSLFVGESAFHPLPGVVRTWATKEQTPVLRHLPTHDRLSVISAIVPDGRLFLRVQERPFDSAGVIAFLGELQE